MVQIYFPRSTLLPFKINAVRCVLDRDFHLIFADNTDSIWDLLGSSKPGYSGLWLPAISQEALTYIRS